MRDIITGLAWALIILVNAWGWYRLGRVAGEALSMQAAKGLASARCHAGQLAMITTLSAMAENKFDSCEDAFHMYQELVGICFSSAVIEVRPLLDFSSLELSDFMERYEMHATEIDVVIDERGFGGANVVGATMPFLDTVSCLVSDDNA